MALLYLFVDSTTNIIQHSQYAQPSTVPTGQTVFSLDDSSPNAMQTQGYPTNYVYLNGAIVQRPYFTVNYANGTLTATLNVPPATPPASVNFVVAGQIFTSALTNSVATLAINLHPSVSIHSVPVTVSANGCVDGLGSLGSGSACPVGLQVFTPTGGVPTVVPVGAGSKEFLEGFYAISPASLMKLLADIGTSVNLLLDFSFRKVLPVLQQTAWAPIPLDANELNAANDIKTNVVPNIFTTLENAFPSGGVKQLQYGDFEADLGKTYTAFSNYAHDLNTIPNLA